MHVIPVADLQAGLVVRGIAGERHRYRPLQSPLCQDSRPATLAEALVTRLGATVVYVADLDALAGEEPDWESYQTFISRGLRLWVDAGLRGGDPLRISRLAGWSDRLEVLLAATETLSGLAGLQRVLDVAGPERTALSLDLRQGTPLADADGWPNRTPEGIVASAAAVGVRRFVVLDIAAVGRNRGPATQALCRMVRRIAPDAQIVSGGGLRNAEDLLAVQACGCDAALVATALHDGRLGREHLTCSRTR